MVETATATTGAAQERRQNLQPSVVREECLISEGCHLRQWLPSSLSLHEKAFPYTTQALPATCPAHWLCAAAWQAHLTKQSANIHYHVRRLLKQFMSF